MCIRDRYFPNHINTELMNVIDMNNIAIETYERGAGYTMANGTGAVSYTHLPSDMYLWDLWMRV